MDVTQLFSFLGGLALLMAGAELLVRAPRRVACVRDLAAGGGVDGGGVRHKLPELAVSVGRHAGHADIALGDVIGSNIFNVLFILGVSALIAPLVVGRSWSGSTSRS